MKSLCGGVVIQCRWGNEGETRPAGIGGVLHNSDGVVLVVLSYDVGCMESNVDEVVTILEALHSFVSACFLALLVVERDSLNAISWVSSFATFPWRYQFNFNEIKYLSSLLRVKFQHMARLGNGFADSLAKQNLQNQEWIDLRIY